MDSHSKVLGNCSRSGGLMAGELEKRVLQLVKTVLGGTVQPTPDWLMRPGNVECGDDWSLVCAIYKDLTGLCLPDEMPRRERRNNDCVLKRGDEASRVIEVDEVQHFSQPAFHYCARRVPRGRCGRLLHRCHGLAPQHRILYPRAHKPGLLVLIASANRQIFRP